MVFKARKDAFTSMHIGFSAAQAMSSMVVITLLALRRFRFEQPDFALAFARIECHYLIHDSFLEPDQLLRDVPKIQHISGVMIQGRYEIVCPARSAWDLHRAWPEAQFHMVPDAGHSATEVGITTKLIEATNAFPDRLPCR
jgi:proline iminopeptidase